MKWSTYLFLHQHFLSFSSMLCTFLNWRDLLSFSPWRETPPGCFWVNNADLAYRGLNDIQFNRELRVFSFIAIKYWAHKFKWGIEKNHSFWTSVCCFCCSRRLQTCLLRCLFDLKGDSVLRQDAKIAPVLWSSAFDSEALKILKTFHLLSKRIPHF